MTSLLPPTASVAQICFAPLHQLLTQCSGQRRCPGLPDADWLLLGLHRVLHESPTGRAFLQQHGFRWENCPAVGHYFEALKSSRRLELAGELNLLLGRRLASSVSDPLAAYPERAGFDIHAGDRHWHGAAAHDARIDGDKRAVGHFFALDLRTHALRHLAVGKGKKEHDMHVLKRLDIALLRNQAPAGRKVIYSWDKAGIDFPFWHRLKQGHGIYFISLEKQNMKLEVQGLPSWDREDPVNAGVQQVELVAGAAGVLLRRIEYVEPLTGKVLVFLSSELTIRPGLIGFLYKLRWDIEKSFDQIKNKVGEKKAWGSSPTAKAMQAQFVCLLHNLLVLLEGRLQAEGVENHAEARRREKEQTKAQARALEAGRIIPTPVLALKRFSQRSVKLIRWLRSSLLDRLAYAAATTRLTALYAVS